MIDFVSERKGESQPRRVIGLGYSNGANILASAQFAAPDLFDATVLMHPLIPFTPPVADFSGRHVLITAGRRDPICPAPASQALGDYFLANGAATTLFWHDGGHELRPAELQETQRFLAALG
ncbi:putative hydrolase MhqD [compost metagenome]